MVGGGRWEAGRLERKVNLMTMVRVSHLEDVGESFGVAVHKYFPWHIILALVLVRALWVARRGAAGAAAGRVRGAAALGWSACERDASVFRTAPRNTEILTPRAWCGWSRNSGLQRSQ